MRRNGLPFPRIQILLLMGVCCLVGGSAQGQNVLIFSAGSFRADRLHVGGQDTLTPHLSRWAQTGTVFQQAYSTSSWEVPALVSLQSGRYPSAHGVNFRDDSPSPDLPTLARAFSSRGFRVGLFQSEMAFSYERLGFPFRNEPLGNDSDTLRQLKDWIGNGSQAGPVDPFYVWFHSRQANLPHNPPGESGADLSPSLKAITTGQVVPIGSVQVLDTDLPGLQRLYDSEIREVDETFGQILQFLGDRGLLESTLIIVAGDHGHELLEHGFIGSASSSLQAKLYEEVVRVPLVFSWPGRLPKGRVRTEPVSLVDVVPTIFDIFGWDHPEALSGSSLFPERSEPERTIFFESAVSGEFTPAEDEVIRLDGLRKGNFKFMGREELYDLKADPGEQTNLVLIEPARATVLRSELLEWRRSSSRLAPSLLAGAQTRPASRPTDCPAILSPKDGSRLEFDSYTGLLLLDWAGNKSDYYLMQYRLGRPEGAISGVFEVLGNHHVIGPMSPQLWEDLRDWGPFQIRVTPRVPGLCWSDWVSFEF